MGKPTRLRIMLTAASTAAAATAIAAGVVETASEGQFAALREAITGILSGWFPFWLAFFALTGLLAGAVQLAFFYNSANTNGAILSKDGILLFDREQHIAINVATLKSILSTLAREAPKGRANDLLYKAGWLAGQRFGEGFEEIYITQIEPHGAKKWSQLNDNDKLDAWERYDATVGWGQINAHKYESNAIVDVVFRHPTLYSGTGGELFSWLLAGYSQQVAGALIGRELQFSYSDGLVRDDGILRLHYTY